MCNMAIYHFLYHEIGHFTLNLGVLSTRQLTLDGCSMCEEGGRYVEVVW